MRHWKSMAIAGAWLAAAGCGGGGGSSEPRAERSESIGGEVATTGEARPVGEDEFGTYAETETWQTPAPSSEPMARGQESWEAEPYGGPESPPHYGESGTSQEYGAAGGMDQPGTAQEPGAMGEPGMMGEPGAEEPELARNALCPADIEGLNVRVATIPRGGALVLTARGEQEVEELRDRLDRFAQMHRRHHIERSKPEQGSIGEPGMSEPGMGEPGMGEPGMMGEHEGHAMGTGQEPQFIDESALIHQASEVRVVEIANGARLEVMMDDQTQIQELRAELREDATMLREGLCPLALQLQS